MPRCVRTNRCAERRLAGLGWPGFAIVASASALSSCTSSAPAIRQASGAQYDSVATEIVAPGIVHRRLVANAGPFSIHVLEVDLRRRDLGIRAARALDSLRGREATSSISRRMARAGPVLAAVNADFFSLRTGENENNQVIEGEVFKGVQITDSPFDSLHTIHSQFGLSCAGHPVLDRFSFEGAVLTPPPATALFPLDAVNFRPQPRADALVLYTARYGTTPNDSASATAELPLRLTNQAGDTLIYRLAGPARTGGGLVLHAGEAALSGTGIAADVLRRMSASFAGGATLRVVTAFRPKRGRLCTLVGGWPRVLNDGRSLADSADRLEGTFPRFSTTRHPRTAIGFSRDSLTLYLITVDGRSESSSGMSLAELADLMRSLGVYQGLNLDGGGSTTMVIRGEVVNHPSDSTGERPVGNAILVVRKRS